MDLDTYNATLRDVVYRVADALGDGWAVDADASYDHGYYVDGGPVRLFVTIDTYGRTAGQRVEIAPATPSGVPPGLVREVSDGRPRAITVGVSRGAESIARDIERRLLPDATVWADQARERLADHLADRDARHALQEELVAALGPDARAVDGSDNAASSRVRYSASGSGTYALIRISATGEDCHIDLRGIPRDTALAIARIVGGTAS